MRPASGDTGRRAFWVTWAALWLLMAVWAVANPLMASPDEPAHVVRAASLVRGQLLPPDGAWGSDVRVPAFYDKVNAYPTCYMFLPDEPGDCEVPAPADPERTVDSATMAGKYNPLYYAVVGLPTLLPPGDGVLYLMRLVSAGLCAFLLALGFRAVAQTPAPAWTVLGVGGALTPMVVFLCSSVNPAGVEIAAAFALWAQMLTLLRHPDPAVTGSRMGWIAVSATVLLNARGLSLLFGAVIVAVAVLSAPLTHVMEVFRTRTTWPWFAVIGVTGIAAAAWVLGAGSLGVGGVAHPDLTFLGVARTTLLSTPDYVTNMVGQFGWMDTNLDPTIHMTFAAAAGLALLLAVALGTWRDRVLLAVVATASVGLPVLIHASQAQTLGIIWQGRYILPVAVGLPVLAGYAVGSCLGARRSYAGDQAPHAEDRLAAAEPLGRALVPTVAGVLALVQLLAWGVNLHRYVNGHDGSWFGLEADAWLPPVPLAVLGVLAVVATAAFAAALVVVARTPTAPPTTSDLASAPEQAPEPEPDPTSEPEPAPEAS